LKEVKLWFARNQENEVVTIGESNRNEEYTCVLCGSKVIPKALESIQVQQHFAHLDVSKCTPEHAIHWWFKNKLIDVGDEILVKTDTINTYICKSFDVEKEYIVDGIIYKPDITIETEEGDIIYVEIANTNKKKFDEYIGIWSKLNNIVVELNIWDVINDNAVGVLRAIYYKGLIFNDKKRKTPYQKSIGEKINRIRQHDSQKEENINRIKSLNWFWSDLCKYKFNKVQIDDLIMSIDEVYKEDQDVIKDLIDKSTCIDIKKDIINYKMNAISAFIKSLKFENKNLEVKGGYSDFIFIEYKKHSNKELKINIYDDENVVKNKIIAFIDDIKLLIKEDEMLDDINIKLYDIFNIKDKNNYKLKWLKNHYWINKQSQKVFELVFYYNDKQFSRLEIPYELNCDMYEIIEYIKNEMSWYFESIEQCINESKLYNICDKLDMLYKNVYIFNKYYERLRFRIIINKVEEDTYTIELFTEDDMSNTNYVHRIWYDRNIIYDIDNKNIQYHYNEENLYQSKFKISEIFNNKISELKKKNEIEKIWGKLPYKN